MIKSGPKASMDMNIINHEEKRDKETIKKDKMISEKIGKEYNSNLPTFYTRIEEGIFPTNDEGAKSPIELLEAGDDVNHQTLVGVSDRNGNKLLELDYFGHKTEILESQIFSFMPHNSIEKIKQDIKNKIVVHNNYPREGVDYKDYQEIMRDKAIFSQTLELLARCINTMDCDYLILPEAYGFIWGAALSVAVNKPIILARKPGKLAGDIISEEYDTEYSTDKLEMNKIDLEGMKVWFVDNVYATGGTYKACKSLISRCGGELTGAAVLECVLDQPEDVYSVL